MREVTFVLFIDHNIYTAVGSIVRFKEKALNLNENVRRHALDTFF